VSNTSAPTSRADPSTCGPTTNCCCLPSPGCCCCCLANSIVTWRSYRNTPAT
jgi:hypothetical protein